MCVKIKSARTNGRLLNSHGCFVLIDSEKLSARSGPSPLNEMACVRPERFDNSSQVLKPLQPCGKHRSRFLEVFGNTNGDFSFVASL